jgi:hypothetical protein
MRFGEWKKVNGYGDEGEKGVKKEKKREKGKKRKGKREKRKNRKGQFRHFTTSIQQVKSFCQTFFKMASAPL